MKTILNIKNLYLNINICPNAESCHAPSSAIGEKKGSCPEPESIRNPKEDEQGKYADGLYYVTGNDKWLKADEYRDGEAYKGIGIIQGDWRFIVAHKGSEVNLVLLEDEPLPGVKYDDYTKALEDKDGLATTNELIKKGSPAATFCRDMGEEWYIPTLNQMCIMHKNKEDLNRMISHIGGKGIPELWHWTSTMKSEICGYEFDFEGGDRDGCYQLGLNRVRPVSAVSRITI